MKIKGGRRKTVALLMLVGLALVAWKTIDPGRMLYLVWILLGGFALRVLLAPGRSGYDEVAGQDVAEQDKGKLM